MGTRGFFVCLEGLDGCGKSTQAKLLVRRLKRNCDAVYTAEPSNGRIGRFIKQQCLHSDKRRLPEVEALLFAADRSEHVENTILPALKKKQIIVSDRYIYSSLAYQGSTGLDLEWINKINEHSIRPDLSLFIDVEPEIVVQRLKPKKSVMENLDTQKKVRQVYMKYVEKGELLRVNGNKPKQEVAQEIFNIVQDKLKKA